MGRIIRLRDAGNSYKVHLNKRIANKFGWNEGDIISLIYENDKVTIENLTRMYDIVEDIKDEVSE